MKLTRALLPAATLALATACLDATYATPAAPADADLTAAASEPPPPPITGRVLYDGTGDGLSAGRGIADRVVASASPRSDCDIPTFCVPARYFKNKTGHNEWLDLVAEEPLPADVRQQLEEFGAACGVTTDDQQTPPTTILCPVGSTGQGRISNKHGEGGGNGLAYDVSDDRLTVTTVALNQLDVFGGKGLVCGSADRGAICTTPPIFGDIWVGSDLDEDGVITYVRTARALSPLRFFGGTTPVPPIDVVP